MAAHNVNGSSPSRGVSDPFDMPLKTGGAEPLIQAPGPDSMLDNPGVDGGNERPPASVPMHAPGWEADSDPLFELNPRQKG